MMILPEDYRAAWMCEIVAEAWKLSLQPCRIRVRYRLGCGGAGVASPQLKAAAGISAAIALSRRQDGGRKTVTRFLGPVSDLFHWSSGRHEPL